MLRKKLSGNIIPVTLIQDIEKHTPQVYFAMESKMYEEFIDIYQFDPTQNQEKAVQIILTLKRKKILVFEQLQDRSFFIIDDQGTIGIYNFKGTTTKLEKTDTLYMHPEDVEKVKKFSDFTRVVVNRDVMIAHIN